MASAPPNPRRGYKLDSFPTSTTFPLSNTRHACPRLATDPERGLKKSATFHSPKSPSSEEDPIVNIPLLSRRSPTSSSALEDAVAANEERVSQYLAGLDRSLSGLEDFAADKSDIVRPEENPVPHFMLAAAVSEDHMDIDSPIKKEVRHHRHSSDSGLGTSVTSDSVQSREDAGKHDSSCMACVVETQTHIKAAQFLADFRKSVPILNNSRTGINGTATTNTQHTLSAYACRQIQKHLIYPILKEETLKSFHPLVTGIPIRVGRKEITCLRDLEKVLLYLAPVSDFVFAWERSLAHGFGVKRFTESRKSFIRFCERSIQCLHTTVEYLNDPDQRRPSDRPYTNSYFVDLTEQVRQYATMISAARQRVAAGQARAEDEATLYESDDLCHRTILTSDRKSKLSLEGGIGHTGRPAQLVRTSNGHSTSLRDGREVDLKKLREEAGATSDQELDEDTLLSMARRRKNAVQVMHRCRECDKEFKRPCDLTKHEKTHSRPWKCGDQSCKYNHYGWPTEKERDRHFNDKHSSTPAMYKCQYEHCPYESKRESNCKQHMEKAHGWAYHRSKNNGRKGRKSSGMSNKAPPTPSSTTPGSNHFEATSPESNNALASPIAPSSSGFNTAEGSVAATSPYMNMSDAYTSSPFEPTFTFNQAPNPALTPESPFTSSAQRPSYPMTNTNNNDATLPAPFNAPQGEMDFPLFDENFDWSNLDLHTDINMGVVNNQLFTPPTSVDAFHSRHPSLTVDNKNSQTQKLSPNAQASLMLYNHDDSMIDEGFADFSSTDLLTGKPTDDFPLFGGDEASQMGGMNLFEGLPPFTSQTWHGPGQAGESSQAGMMEE